MSALLALGAVETSGLPQNWPDSYPTWWYLAEDPSNGFINSTFSNFNSNNQSALNQGQLWNMTSQAIAELDVQLSPIGGSGFDLEMFKEPGTIPDYYAPANLGQLKFVSSKFYELFHEIGYTPVSPDPSSLGQFIPIPLIAEGSLSGIPMYPWVDSQSPDNFFPAVIGQAKYVFSWDLSSFVSADTEDNGDGTFGDGLPDWWELYYFSDLGRTPIDDFDNDSIFNLDEFIYGLDPTGGIIDSNNNNFPDDWETVLYGGNVPVDADFDGDRISDLDEFSRQKNPANFDQDTDGNLDHIYENDLIAFWNFDNRDGTLIKDNSPNGYDFALAAGTEIKVKGTEEYLRQTLDRTGAVTSINQAFTDGTGFIDDFSVSFWVQAFSSSNVVIRWLTYQFSFDQINNSVIFWRRGIQFDDNAEKFDYIHANNANITLGDSNTEFALGFFDLANILKDGFWHNITLVISPVSGDPAVGTVKYYLDGTLVETVADLSQVDFTAPVFSLQHQGVNIDDIRIFDRALTDNEVNYLRYGLQFFSDKTDTVSPEVPSKPLFQTTDQAAIASWGNSTDDVKLNGYIVSRNNRPYRFLKETELFDRVDGDFSYSVRSFDYDQNVSSLKNLGMLNLNTPPVGNITLELNAGDVGVSVNQLDLVSNYTVRINMENVIDDGEISLVRLFENDIYKKLISPLASFQGVIPGAIGATSYYVEFSDEQGAVTQSNTVTINPVQSPDIVFENQDYPARSLLLSASSGKVPQPFIKLDWPEDTRPANYVIARKSIEDGSWQTLRVIKGTTTEYIDTDISVGETYDYRVARVYTGYSSITINKVGYSYITASIEAPLIDDKGTVLLVIDNTIETPLRVEIDRFKEDLIGDGWTKVVEKTVERDVDAYTSTTDTTPDPLYASRVQAVKTLIANEYNSAPDEIKAVVLLGRVPIPYSGHNAWDGHSNHIGGWPADMYYGDVVQVEGDGDWEDVINPTYNQSRYARNRNLPSDGKFDNNFAPSNIELPIGRIDLADMDRFSDSEVALLRNYLNKNHNFRHGLVTTREKGIIDIDISYNKAQFLRSGYSSTAFNNLSAMFGHSNIDASNKNGADLFGSTVESIGGDSYLFGYGAGPGSATGAGSLFNGRTTDTPNQCGNPTTNWGTTCDFADYDPQIMFTVLFGSYFGDWSINNSLLRAPLAADTYGLSCLWGSNGSFIDPWIFHRVGLGYSLGECLLLSQNNRDTYFGASGGNGDVPLSLMGDPTLNIFTCLPASNLSGNANGSSVTLTWAASAGENVVGYHVYREVNDTFERLTSSPINGLTFTDEGLSPGAYKYMVRAVELKTSGSGSFYNASQGIFEELTIN